VPDHRLGRRICCESGNFTVAVKAASGYRPLGRMTIDRFDVIELRQ
jgi:hypothetical protein